MLVTGNNIKFAKDIQHFPQKPHCVYLLCCFSTRTFIYVPLKKRRLSKTYRINILSYLWLLYEMGDVFY